MPRATSPGFASDPHPDISSRLVLRHGTPAQRHAVLQDTAVMWSGQLTADQYVGLSELADLDEYGSQNMTFLVLVDREDDKIYASAEVWIRTAFTVLPGQTQVVEERAAALHHLYVPPQARGHGLGRLFLRELFKWIDGKAELVYGFAQAGEGVFRNTSAFDRQATI